MVPSSPKVVMLRVRRHCLVCEWDAVVEEPEDTLAIGAPCPECQAPSERIEVLGRRVAATTATPHAAALGRLGGLKGGPARAKALAAERRRDIAQAAARARWRTHRNDND
jgi:hypothetical protein